MTINIPAHNGKNGNGTPENVPSPLTGSSGMFDPSSLESMANQLYSALPNANSVTAPAGTQPAVENMGTVPQPDSNSSGMGGVALLGNSAVGNSAPARGGGEDAFTAMAKQMRAQMIPANLEANLFQALAQLQPAAPSQEKAAGLPTSQFQTLGQSPPSAPAQPTSAGLPTSQFQTLTLGQSPPSAPAQPTSAELPTSQFQTLGQSPPSAPSQPTSAELPTSQFQTLGQSPPAPPSQPTSAGLPTSQFQTLGQSQQAPPSQPTSAGLPTNLASTDVLSVEALKAVAQQLYAQIPQISPSGIPGNSIATPPKPTSVFPLSEADLQKVLADANSQTSQKPVQETSQPSFYFLSPPAVENLGLESGAPFDVSAIRKDFPILHQKVNGKPLIWLDNAATTQKPQSVIDSLSLFYERDNSNIHRGAHTLAARATDAYEGAREKVQRFIGASSASEIIFLRGTTEAINLVAQSYGRKYIKPGDEIVLSTLEHHANIVPWQMLAQQTGAILKVIPVTERGEIMLEEYARLLGPRTRIVSITQVSNALGTVVPVREMTQIAHRHGAVVLVDGAQAVSHMPVNVQDIGCDFYTFSGHKLFGPTGIGALYAKREILEDMPPWQGGGSMIRHVTFERTIYSDPPAKFEAGTPNIADAVGLGAAIDYITRLGMSNIERYDRQLTEYAMERLAQIPGLHLIGTAPEKVSVLSFILDDIPVEQVGQRLAREGIAVRAGHHCAQPTMQRYNLTGTVRPSLAFYNTCQEIDTLVEVLRTIRFR